MSITKITSASVRVSLSYNYNTFEVTLGFENQDGINDHEIEEFRLTAQSLANDAVDDFKLGMKQDIQKPIVTVLRETGKEAEILKQPMYNEKRLKQIDPANHKEFERITYLINDCLTIKELMKLKKDVPAELNDIFNQKFAEIGDATNGK